MAEARRIARLATSQGGYYLDALWAIAAYALDEKDPRLCSRAGDPSNQG